MKFFFKRADGGPESNVTGYWLCEGKSSFSICLLRFASGSRENFHSHAFNSFAVVLFGRLAEEQVDGMWDYWTFLRFLWVPRSRFHRVYGHAKYSWVLNLRGPWSSSWEEYDPATKSYLTLTKGRVITGVRPK